MKKENKTSLATLLSKSVDNNFLFCKIDTLRYDRKHCLPANQSMREEYNKFCEKLRTIIRTEKEKYQKTKNCANDQRK